MATGSRASSETSRSPPGWIDVPRTRMFGERRTGDAHSRAPRMMVGNNHAGSFIKFATYTPSHPFVLQVRDKDRETSLV